jgi:Bacterial archaeo-eukaryotic release factor family 3
MRATDHRSPRESIETIENGGPAREGEPIERITPEIVAALAAEQGGSRMTFYLPIDHGHPHAQPARARCQNLLREATERLIASGLLPEAADEELAPVDRLLHAIPGPWDPAADGLAVFASGGTARAFALPLAPREEVVVGERFYLRPVLPLLGEERRFHVLALSRNAVRLLACDDWSARPVHLPDLPASLVDAAVCAAPGVRDQPLVLAGVGYVVAEYRAISRHARIVAEAVLGNADELPDEELHRRAWKAVRPALQLRESHAAERVRELAGTPRTCFDLDHTLRAARQGRVEALFLAEDAEAWGLVDPAGSIELHPARRSGDDDLLDLAATLTIGRGGEVYNVPADEVPAAGPLAAVLRY